MFFNLYSFQNTSRFQQLTHRISLYLDDDFQRTLCHFVFDYLDATLFTFGVLRIVFLLFESYTSVKNTHQRTIHFYKKAATDNEITPKMLILNLLKSTQFCHIVMKNKNTLPL